MRYQILMVLAPLAFGEAVPGRYIIELTGDSVVEHVTRRRGPRRPRGGPRFVPGRKM